MVGWIKINCKVLYPDIGPTAIAIISQFMFLHK